MDRKCLDIAMEAMKKNLEELEDNLTGSAHLDNAKDAVKIVHMLCEVSDSSCMKKYEDQSKL